MEDLNTPFSVHNLVYCLLLVTTRRWGVLKGDLCVPPNEPPSSFGNCKRLKYVVLYYNIMESGFCIFVGFFHSLIAPWQHSFPHSHHSIAFSIQGWMEKGLAAGSLTSEFIDHILIVGYMDATQAVVISILWGHSCWAHTPGVKVLWTHF